VVNVYVHNAVFLSDSNDIARIQNYFVQDHLVCKSCNSMRQQ